MDKAAAWLTLFAIAGWGAFTWAIKRPAPLPKIVERVQYVDRVVEKTTHRETKKPDGTVVKETVVQNSRTEKKAQQVVKETAKAPLSRYSLGVGIMPLRDLKPFQKPVYTLMVGYRLGDLPAWLQIGITTRKDLIFQTSIEF